MIQKHKIVAAESVVDTYMDEDIYTMVAGVENEMMLNHLFDVIKNL